MGNCTGVFSNCCGDDQVIKKVDQDAMRKALKSNGEYAHGNRFDAD